MVNKLFVLLITLLIVLSSIGCHKSTSTINKNTETQVYELCRYTDTRFSFSLDYPKDWDADIDNTWKNNSNIPDSGIKVFINSNTDNFIWIYGCVGTVNGSPQDLGFREPKNCQKEIIEAKSGAKCTLYVTSDIDGRIQGQIAFDQFHGATINCDNKEYEVNKQKILAIFKSIYIQKEV
jgi:hypothetical protein